MGKKIEKDTKSKNKPQNGKTENKAVEKDAEVKNKRAADKKKSKKDKKENRIQNESEKHTINDKNVEDIMENENILNEQEENTQLESILALYERSKRSVEDKLKLDEKQIQKAVKCLKAIIHNKYKDNLNLLSSEDEEFIFINFLFGKLPFKYSLRPVTIHLPNSLYGEKYNTRVCLFVKDPRSDFKDLNLNLPFAKFKVLDIGKLKLKYSRFQERRNLLKEYEIFLCDSKIYFLLKKLLGKPFYVHKKYPVPIKLDYTKPEEIKNDIISHIENSSIFNMSNGPNYSIKVARAVMKQEELTNNIIEGIHNTLPHILKWGIDFEE
jgi:ribosome biogenesis protein UTP30